MSTKVTATSDYRATPDAEYRFFLYDPNEGMQFFKSAEIRDQIAAAGIALYCDGDGWSEEVVHVCAGEVNSRATKTNVETRPVRADFETDEEFEDAEEEWPCSDFDATCNFELLPLPAHIHQ